MTSPLTLIGLSGSLRRESLNTRLLRAAGERLPPGCRLVIGSIAEIPLYNADLETAQGIPASVTALKDQIAAADGLLIASPEYNNSMPGVLKNAIDWLSRAPQLFDDSGRLSDEAMAERLGVFLADFVADIRAKT